MSRVSEQMNERPSASFSAFVESHMRKIYRLAFELTRSHHDAEDLTQEVFIKAWRSMDKLKNQANADSWLYRITVNTYLNSRRRKAQRFMSLRADLAEFFSSSNGEETSRSAEAAAIRKHVDRAMKQLSTRERTAFVLRCRHLLSIRETATAMGIAEGTVKSLQYRAVQKLQEELAFLNPNR